MAASNPSARLTLRRPQRLAGQPVLWRRLQRWAPPPVCALLHRLQQAGGHPVLVGGVVRDALLGQRPRDWDVAVDLPSAQVSGLFPRVVQTGVRHGTVMVIMPGASVEVSTFRAASTGSWEQALMEDLGHRDFTINAMAVIWPSGALLDPYGGRADLLRWRLRAVVDGRARITEDPLRALRAVRFMATWGLRIELETRRALAVALAEISRVAPERIHQEMVRTLSGPHLTMALALLHECGLADVLLAAASPLTPPPRPRMWRPFADATLPAHLPWLRCAYWFATLGLSAAAGARVLQQWRAAKVEQKAVQAWLEGLACLGPVSLTGYELRRWTACLGSAYAPGAARLAAARWPHHHANLPRRVARLCRIGCLSVEQLAIGGRDLQKLGLAGVAVGEMLARLLDAVLVAPQRNRKEVLLRLAHKLSTG